MKGISVIICCYNSAGRLPDTLKHLALQEVPLDVEWEIIVVNNASTDNTKDVAQAEWARYNLRNIELKEVNEPTPGLNYARKKGIDESNYEYLIFCDDDNWLCKDYIFKVYDIFELMPEVGMIGGVGEAAFESSPPKWFLEMEGFGYAVGVEGRNTGYVNSVYGAGMAIRKFLFLSIINKGISFVLTDRNGASLSSGGDSEISLLMNLAGQKIYLDTSLRFKHFLTAKRLDWKYYLRLRRSFGKANAYLNLYDKALFPQSAKQKENRLKQFLLLSRYLLRHFPYILFPQYFENSRCANCVQAISMQLTTFLEFKKLHNVGSQLRLNLRKANFNTTFI